jgi:hypothetical protein
MAASSIELQLVPAPGQKPEFLATLEPALKNDHHRSLWSSLLATSSSSYSDSSSSTSSSSPSTRVVIILEGYTRDSWALSFPSSFTEPSNVWQHLTVRSIDGRHKVPGFVSYLQQRNKVAYGRFVYNNQHSSSSSTTSSTRQQQQQKTGVWIIPPHTLNDNHVMTCWIALDITRISNCTLAAISRNHISDKQQQSQPPPQQQSQLFKANNSNTSDTKQSAAGTIQKPPPSTAASTTNNNHLPRTTTTTAKRGGGLLGNLVGAQQRTNEHLFNAPVKKQPEIKLSDENSAHGHGASVGGGSGMAATSAAQVLEDFRHDMQQKLLDFDTETHEQVLEIPIRWTQYIQGLHTPEERAKVSMEVLKYLVQEQVDDINEEWVVYQPPSEFMDEVTLTIYKEAPPEILEEINQGILPEEVKQQQRALQSERQKAVNLAEAKRQAELRTLALRQATLDSNGGDGDNEEDDDNMLARLNTVKRDRRTVEDYQREMASSSSSSSQAKKSKFS